MVILVDHVRFCTVCETRRAGLSCIFFLRKRGKGCGLLKYYEYPFIHCLMHIINYILYAPEWSTTTTTDFLSI